MLYNLEETLINILAYIEGYNMLKLDAFFNYNMLYKDSY